jgi:hypothetical protein
MMDTLQALAQKVGLEIRPAEKRGEVIIAFPARDGGVGFALRLSRVKALALLMWIENLNGGRRHG